MTTFVPFIAYFGDGIACPLSNDIMGMVLSYIDEDAVNTIKKVNKVLRDMSHKDWHFVIHCGAEQWGLDNYIYDKHADYTTSLSRLRHNDIRIICWAVKYMPFIYSPDTRKKKWECLGQEGKHHLEHLCFGHGLMTNGIYKNNKGQRKYYEFRIPELKTHYVTRIATVLSFMVTGFERVPVNECECRKKHRGVCFKCREPRWTSKLIKENLHIMGIDIHK